MATLLQVVLLVLLLSYSSTPSTTPVLVLPMTPSRPRVEEPVNSTVSSTFTRRLLPRMVLPVSTVVSSPRSSVSSCIVVSTLVFTIHSVSFKNSLVFMRLYPLQSLSSSLVLSKAHSWLPSVSVGVSPLVLVLLPTLSIPFVVV